MSLTQTILDDLYKRSILETENYQADIDKQLKSWNTEIEKLMDRAMNTKNEIMAENLWRNKLQETNGKKEKLLENNSKSDNFDVDFGTACDEVMSVINNQ